MSLADLECAFVISDVISLQRVLFADLSTCWHRLKTRDILSNWSTIESDWQNAFNPITIEMIRDSSDRAERLFPHSMPICWRLKKTSNKIRLKNSTTNHEKDVDHRPSIDPRWRLLKKIKILLIEHFHFDLTFTRLNHPVMNRIDHILNERDIPSESHSSFSSSFTYMSDDRWIIEMFHLFHTR